MDEIHCRKTKDGKYIFRLYSNSIKCYFDRIMTRKELLDYLNDHRDKIPKRYGKHFDGIIDRAISEAKRKNFLHNTLWFGEIDDSSH